MSAEVLKRKCTRCHQLLPLDNFYIDKRTNIGRRSICKKCTCNITIERRISKFSNMPDEEITKYKKYTIQKVKESRQRHPEKFEAVKKVRQAIKKEYFADRKHVLVVDMNVSHKHTTTTIQNHLMLSGYVRVVIQHYM